MLSGLLAELLVQERAAQREREMEHARRLREAGGGRSVSRTWIGAARRSAAGGVLRLGMWLERAGYRVQALGGTRRPMTA